MSETNESPTTTQSPTSKPSSSSSPHIYLLLENPSRANNLGPILRCANAFGVTTIVAVGQAKCAVHGSHGANKNVRLVACPTIDQAVSYCRHELHCQGAMVGLLGALPNGYDHVGYVVCEDTSGVARVRTAEDRTTQENVLSARSFPVSHSPFPGLSANGGNVCIVLSKLYHGLPARLARHCDVFVHVPHVALAPKDTEAAEEGVSSPPVLLDIPCTLSMTLHHLTNWLSYDERTFQGHKFQVTRPGMVRKSNVALSGNEEQSAGAGQDQPKPVVPYEDIAADSAFGAIFGAIGNEEQSGDY